MFDLQIIPHLTKRDGFYLQAKSDETECLIALLMVSTMSVLVFYATNEVVTCFFLKEHTSPLLSL